MALTSLEYHVIVTLPLLVLAVPIPIVLPVALANLLLAVGVCTAAAVQASLPRNKQRPWSRPLVALLFFLQPIVRGWARYHYQLQLHPAPKVPGDQLAAVSTSDPEGRYDQVCYWGEGHIDRVEWINGIVARLDQHGWPSKTDEGWSEHDIEIYGSRWSKVQLITATEDFGSGKRLFRCRLRASWSLAAEVAFGSAFAFELLVIGVVGRAQPWLWSLLLTMPIFGWFLHQEKKSLQRLVAAFLDTVARQRNLTKLRFDAGSDKFTPVS
jgi:hypothetical protein